MGMEAFSIAVRAQAPDLPFTVIDVGARLIEESIEEYYRPLLSYSDNSRVIAFDVDEEACAQIQRAQGDKATVISAVLGRKRETRTFYTTHCRLSSSLYKPQPLLNSGVEHTFASDVDYTSQVETVSLDEAISGQGITNVSLLKIDVQGAELDVLEGSQDVLQKTLMIVAEVEFQALYENQPLFGDVCEYLAGVGFHFHRFFKMLGMCPPYELASKNGLLAQLWSDAVFVPSGSRLISMSPEDKLRLALMANQYDVFDLCSELLRMYDRETGSSLHPIYLRSLKDIDGEIDG